MSQTDATVLKLIQQVKDKKKQIANSEKPKWETSCVIGTSPDSVSDRFNIQTVTDTKKLVDIYGFLTLKESSWDKAAKELGVAPSNNWMGSSFDAWKRDIKNRVDQININTKRKELESLETRLDKLISVEQRRELELEDIAKSLE